MTWSLGAAGHVAEELEHELVEKLHEVLADPRFGAAAIRFVGDFVTRDLLHTIPIETAPAVPDASVQEQPDPQGAQTPGVEAPETTAPADAPSAPAAADAKPATK